MRIALQQVVANIMEQRGGKIVRFSPKNPCIFLRGYAMIRASSDVMTNVGKKTLKQSDGRLAQLVERIPYKD
jgi:hypothetical protein